jgi:hypothetical protein
METVELRRRLQEARTLHEEFESFFQLVEQPDVTWRDLLDGLQHPGLVAEGAAIRLHRALEIPVASSGVVMDRSSWERILQENGIEPDSPTAGPP